MRNLLIVFLILTLFLMIILFPFKIRFMMHLNLLKKKGFYSLKILGIRLLCGQIYLDKDNKIVVENSINIIKQESNKDFIIAFMKQFSNKMDVRKIEMFFTGGLENDSYTSALLCGTISAGVETFYSVLSQKYENVKLYEDITPTFNDNSFELTLDVVVKISLFSLIVSIIKAALANNKFKEMKNEGRL